MRAAILHEAGPPENLVVSEIDTPEPGSGAGAPRATMASVALSTRRDSGMPAKRTMTLKRMWALTMRVAGSAPRKAIFGSKAR